MHNFVFALPTRVVFGAGSIDQVGSEAVHCGKRALVVTGTTFAMRSGLIDRLRSSLTDAGVAVTIYDQAGPNPRIEAIDEGGHLAREYEIDFVVGVGGGSALDAAKAIALVAVSGRPITDYMRRRAEAEPLQIENALPIVQIPIIASTGSETNGTAVLFDESARTNSWISSTMLIARVAIVDPSLTFTVPPKYTAVGGMNIVSQMLERYLTSDEFPVTDRITEGLVRVVMDSLPRAMRRGEDLDARTNLSWAAVIASTIGVAGRGDATPLRSMAHPLTARFGVEHGRAVAALWPSYMRYALANRFRLPQIGRFKRYALLGRQIFGVHETDDEVASEMAAYRMQHWLRGIDMPTSLLDLGISDIETEEVTRLADEAVLGSGKAGRLAGGLSPEDVEHVYDGALRPL